MGRWHGKTPSNFDMTDCLFGLAEAGVGACLPSMSADPFNLHAIAALFDAPNISTYDSKTFLTFFKFIKFFKFLSGVVS